MNNKIVDLFEADHLALTRAVDLLIQRRNDLEDKFVLDTFPFKMYDKVALIKKLPELDEYEIGSEGIVTEVLFSEIDKKVCFYELYVTFNGDMNCPECVYISDRKASKHFRKLK